MPMKNGQRSQFNNSGSALGLLPWSFDFYKLTIQASGEHETTPQVRPAIAPVATAPDFPMGLQVGKLGMTTLLPTKSPQKAFIS